MHQSFQEPKFPAHMIWLHVCRILRFDKIGFQPVGYPEGPTWTGPKWIEFKGVSKSSKEVGTQIIFSLLRAQNIDPENHGPQKELDSSDGGEDNFNQVTESDNNDISVFPDDA